MPAVGSIDDGRSADGCMGAEEAENAAAAAKPLELGIFELAWTASRVDDLCLRVARK